MEHKCYDNHSIWAYINYKEDDNKTTQIIVFDPNYYQGNCQILAELDRLDRYNSITSIEICHPNGIISTCRPPQGESKWKITNKLDENFDRAYFKEYTKKDAVEWQWL